MRAWLTPVRIGLLAVGVSLVVLAPIWPDSISGRFTVEPGRRAVVRAESAGEVDHVYVQEGATVAAGASLVRLRNLGLESEAARAKADLAIATARATQAQLRYASFGSAERERQQLAERERNLAEKVSRLQVVTPVSGVVVTPRLHDLTGSYLKEGTEIAEVDDLSSVRVRIFVPELAVRDLREGALADLKLDALFSPVKGHVVAIAPVNESIPEGLIPTEKYYQGFREPGFYAATIEVPSSAELHEGMPGTGKIRVGHRSLAGFAWRLVHDTVSRKIW